MPFIYQEKDWPNFKWDMLVLLDPLVKATHKHGILLGQLSGLAPEIKAKAELESLTNEILVSASSEGIELKRGAVRSALSQKLGINIGDTGEPDSLSQGYANLICDAVKNPELPLSAERLFAWSAYLSQSEAGGVKFRISEAWRTAMTSVRQAFSGARNETAYEPPAPYCLTENMQMFIAWYNLPYLAPEAKSSLPPKYDIHPVLEAGLCYLWFMAIHPFDRHNSLFAQTLADSILSRYTDVHGHFYSISEQMQKNRKHYQHTLEQSLQNGLDITPWLLFFIEALEKAVDESLLVFSQVLEKVLSWEAASELPLNRRQKHILHHLLDNSKLQITTSAYAIYVKCSPDTALRDIRDLIGLGVLERSRDGGRNTKYALIINNNLTNK